MNLVRFHSGTSTLLAQPIQLLVDAYLKDIGLQRQNVRENALKRAKQY